MDTAARLAKAIEGLPEGHLAAVYNPGTELYDLVRRMDGLPFCIASDLLLDEARPLLCGKPGPGGVVCELAPRHEGTTHASHVTVGTPGGGSWSEPGPAPAGGLRRPVTEALATLRACRHRSSHGRPERVHACAECVNDAVAMLEQARARYEGETP